MKFRGLYFLIAFSISLFSCEDEETKIDECNAPRACTYDLRSVSIEIKNTDGEPVILDDFYTFFDSRKKLEYEYFSKENGVYPVLTDSEISHLDRSGTTLIFVGEKDGKNLVEHQMVIGHDCCHVILIEGDDKIVIEDL